MADCPYARCIQERRHIRRELLRWTKNMVFVVGLERVAEELMGRRRWKQYQDTLYSGTRSSESTTAQPHHRLYPALSSSCNPIPGGLDQIGPQLHHPVSSSLPAAIASTALTTATTTTATTLASSGVKQESLQRHHLQNHHHHLQQQEDLRRLRPGEIKVETGDEEPADGVTAREDIATTRTTDPATSATAIATGATTTTTATAATTTAMTTTTASATTTASGTTTITTRRRRGRRQIDGEDVDGEEDGDENDEETGRGQNEAEKRLKLDVDADRSAASPLRTENDRANHPIANATDTEGTKDKKGIMKVI